MALPGMLIQKIHATAYFQPESTAQFFYHKYNCQYQCDLTKTEAIICDKKIGSGILEV